MEQKGTLQQTDETRLKMTKLLLEKGAKQKIDKNG